MLNILLINVGRTFYPKYTFSLCRDAAHTIFSSAFSLCGTKVLLCAQERTTCPSWNPLVSSLFGKNREQPSTPGQRAGGGPGGGALTAWEGRRNDAPKAPGPSWTLNPILFPPSIEREVYPNFLRAPGFTSGFLMVLKDHLPSLFSKWRWQVSVCFKYCCGGTDFSKELSFITGHAGALSFMSLESSTMCCVKRIGLDAKHNWLFYRNAKKGSYFQKHVKIGGIWKGKCDKSVAYCTLSLFACWIHLGLLRGTNWREFSRKQQILRAEWKNSDKILSWFNYPMYC